MTPQFGSAPFLIAGPCVVESDDLNLRVGEGLADLAAKLGLHVIYKASYDKANRSRLQAARGPGLELGLRALERVRGATGPPSSPTSTRRTTSRPPPRWPTCCRSRRSSVARRTSSSPQGRQGGR